MVAIIVGEPHAYGCPMMRLTPRVAAKIRRTGTRGSDKHIEAHPDQTVKVQLAFD